MNSHFGAKNQAIGWRALSILTLAFALVLGGSRAMAAQGFVSYSSAAHVHPGF